MLNALTVKFAILSHTRARAYSHKYISRANANLKAKFRSAGLSLSPLSLPSPPPPRKQPYPFILFSSPSFIHFFVYFSAFKCFTVSFLSLSGRSLHLSVARILFLPQLLFPCLLLGCLLFAPLQRVLIAFVLQHTEPKQQPGNSNENAKWQWRWRWRWQWKFKASHHPPHNNPVRPHQP